MTMPQTFLRRFINLGLILAWLVLMLGAYTRLTDAGLGCPDWPGCYGHMVLPTQQQALSHAQQTFPAIPIEASKAWTEMAHRYLAGSLLTVIMVILLLLLTHSAFKGVVRPVYLVILIGLLGFQAALGMWTVTLKLLPQVVSSHLLGGFLIFSVLAILRTYFSKFKPLGLGAWRWGLSFGVLLILLQVALGAWVSSNYAAISCLGFPQCNGLWVPPLNWTQAFNFLQPLGVNYQGGILEVDARMTIQWVHRVGAILVWAYWFVVSILLWFKLNSSALKSWIIGLQGLLTLQIILGVVNVTMALPLASAVLHNGVGALILATTMCITALVCGQRVKKNA
jgi:cytochrome c oxidase assembly protein subunit 15